MFAMLTCVAALGMAIAAGQAATEYEVSKRLGIVYAMHDHTKLVGDLYLPKNRTSAPLLIAMHGGGWRGGGRGFYKYWGPFLARHGYALLAIEYRLGKSGAYPAAFTT